MIFTVAAFEVAMHNVGIPKLTLGGSVAYFK